MKSHHKGLVSFMRSAYWWPAVNRLWQLQAFEVNTDNEYINDIYLLIRFVEVSDGWPSIVYEGLKTRRSYAEED
ncbi:MAG: hypothetical protein QM762_12505 [Chryseolinea sp.]